MLYVGNPTLQDFVLNVGLYPYGDGFGPYTVPAGGTTTIPTLYQTLAIAQGAVYGLQPMANALASSGPTTLAYAIDTPIAADDLATLAARNLALKRMGVPF